MIQGLSSDAGRYEPDSPYAWLRLAVALVIGTVACVGSWSVVVVLPAMQGEFDTLRSGATLPYTLAMLGFGAGNIAMGRIADRYHRRRTAPQDARREIGRRHR